MCITVCFYRLGDAQIYYGAVLCCCYSHDGGYIAAGGEDDLVTVYDVAEHTLVAWGEGHASYVSRVVFDPWWVTVHC